MRNESDYLYYFSSEQKSEPKHAVVKYGPKHLKNHRHIRAIHLLALCYLLIAATLMSTSVSFSKYSSSSDISVQSATVASFNSSVNELSNEEFEKIKNDKVTRTTYGLSDSDVVVSAFKVSNANEKGVSEVALSCDVSITLSGNVTFNVTYDSTVGDNGGLLYNSESDRLNFEALGTFRDNGESKFKLIVFDNSTNMLNGSYNPIASKSILPNSSNNVPMPIISFPTTLPVDMLFNPEWTNNIKFAANEEKSYTCIVAIDTSELKYTGEPFTLRSPNSSDNLTVTVNQVD